MTTTEGIEPIVIGGAAGERQSRTRGDGTGPRGNMQAAYRRLFGTAAPGLSVSDRYLVAAFVAELADPGSAVARGYAERVDDQAVLAAVVESAAEFGLWGPETKPALPDELGDWWEVPAEWRTHLTSRLVAVLEHAHFSVLHPGAARPRVLAKLAAAGWARSQIVTWSQLISFVGFQVRAAAGFTVLADHVG